jgi:hypothetical protein
LKEAQRFMMSKRFIIATVCICLLGTGGLVSRVCAGAESALSDATKETLQSALRASFLRDKPTLMECYERLKRAESVRHAPLAELLSDNVYGLLVACAKDREARMDAYRNLRAVADDDYSNAIAYAGLGTDELLKARRLLRENLYNHFVGTFNYISASASRFINGNTQAVLQVFIDGLFSFRRLGRISDRERESLVLLKCFSDKYPLSPENDWAERKTVRLESKLETKQLEENLVESERAVKTGNTHSALFFADRALESSPDSEQAKRLRLKASADASREERAIVASATVWEHPDVFDSRDRHARYHKALENVFLSASPVPVSPSGSSQTQRADLFLPPRPVEPDRYLIDSYARASAEVRTEKLRYLALGERSSEDRAYIISSGIVQGAYDALENLGVFFVFDTALRGVKLALGSPVPEDSAIDAGARYVRRFPDTADAQRICREIAARYERAGDYENASAYYARGGSASPKKLSVLTEKAAKRLLIQIREVEDGEQRLQYLKSLTKQYPQTKAAKTATREIAKLEQSLDTEYIFSKSDMRQSPRLFSDDALGIAPDLVDGSDVNGEIDDDGVRVLRNNIAVYREKGEPRTREIALDAERKKKLDSLHAELQYRDSSRSNIKRLKQRQFIPIEISGSIGGQGVLAYPTLKPIAPDGEHDESGVFGSLNR